MKIAQVNNYKMNPVSFQARKHKEETPKNTTSDSRTVNVPLKTLQALAVAAGMTIPMQSCSHNNDYDFSQYEDKIVNVCQNTSLDSKKTLEFLDGRIDNLKISTSDKSITLSGDYRDTYFIGLVDKRGIKLQLSQKDDNSYSGTFNEYVEVYTKGRYSDVLYKEIDFDAQNVKHPFKEGEKALKITVKSEKSAWEKELVAKKGNEDENCYYLVEEKGKYKIIDSENKTVYKMKSADLKDGNGLKNTAIGIAGMLVLLFVAAGTTLEIQGRNKARQEANRKDPYAYNPSDEYSD